MVKTRRRNYRNVTFDDEDDVREVSSTTSEESGGSDEGAVNDDPGGAVVDDPTLADGDANSSPPPTVLPAEKDEKGEEEKEEEEEEKDPECKDLLPPFAPISQLLKSVAEVDVSLTQSMAMAATPSSPLGCIRPALRLLEFSCHGVPWLILAVTLLMIGAESSLVRHGHLLVLLLVDLIIVGISKAIFRRQRPAINIEDDVLTVSVDKFSFPSGHATRATLLLFYLCAEYFATDSTAQTLIIFWSTCVILSRVIIGRHHVSDVIAGCLVGTLVFLRLSPMLLPLSARVAESAASVNQRHWILVNIPDCLTKYI